MRFRYTSGKNGRPVKAAVVYTREEHGIKSADVDKDAVYIVDRLQANGFETYIVGGAVRDLILGKRPKDFDIVTAANPLRIKKVFRNARVIGRRFRLVHVFFGPKIFEVSTFRSLKDGITSNTFGTIEEDVFRRDFSLNALFYDPLEQVVVDYVEGMKDIREKLIKPVIPLKVIFTDDPVRMIRAVKYAAATGFSLPWLLRRRIRREAPLLASVSPSRLTEEMLKIIRSPCAAVIVESLEAYGLYGSLQAGASRLMRERPSFKARYLKTLAGLDIRNAGLTGSSPGEALAALVRDYLEETVEWDAGTVENYQAAFALARSFVLPINPPRVELDRAVRLVFAEHGHPIKRSHAAERGRAPEGETRKRRRRRRTVSGTDPRAQGPAGD